MPFFVDATKTGLENFYDLVARSNPKAIYIPDHVNLGVPVTDEETGLTTVSISPKPNSGYVPPEVEVSYYRQPPVEAAGTQLKGRVELENREYSQVELKAFIASHLDIISGDVVITGFGADGSINIPEFVGDNREDYRYQITSRSDSYMYDDRGQPPFEGDLISGEKNMPLEFAIASEQLSGFEPKGESVPFDSFFTSDTLAIL